MAVNRGKQFEEQFKKDFLKTFPNGFILRLPDQMSGYKSYSQNPCDFICFIHGKLFLIECKSHKGASLPFDAITQYDKLVSYDNIPGVYIGVVIWLYDKDKVLYAPISLIKQLKQEGKKSIGIKALDEYSNLIEIPSDLSKGDFAFPCFKLAKVMRKALSSLLLPNISILYFSLL